MSERVIRPISLTRSGGGELSRSHSAEHIDRGRFPVRCGDRFWSWDWLVMVEVFLVCGECFLLAVWADAGGVSARIDTSSPLIPIQVQDLILLPSRLVCMDGTFLKEGCWQDARSESLTWPPRAPSDEESCEDEKPPGSALPVTRREVAGRRAATRPVRGAIEQIAARHRPR